MESMTGISIKSCQKENFSCQWTLKSVNGKSLDVRVKMPSGYDDLEVQIREKLRSVLARGSVSVFLEVQTEDKNVSAKIDMLKLDDLCALSKHYHEKYPHMTTSFDGLLWIPGILGEKKETREEAKQKQDCLMQTFEQALTDLKKSRQSEGEKIAVCLNEEINQMEDLVQQAENCAAVQPERIREKLVMQIKQLQGDTSLTEERFVQEVTACMLRADVREEIDRLKAHLVQAKSMLTFTEPVGRKFDFLCQELNRETNTLCSKSSDIALTRIGMALKSVIDQFREQIQNIE